MGNRTDNGKTLGCNASNNNKPSKTTTQHSMWNVSIINERS